MPDYPEGGRIAFQTDRDGNDEIYIMGCGGESATNLTSNAADDRGPSWASNGTLAFSSDRDSVRGSDIYLLTLDPWNIERVTTNAANDESPAMSTDGSKVAFVSFRDGNSEIYVLELSSSNLTRLTNNSAADMDPAWSSDGTRLAFASDRDGDWDIFIADADGTNPANLTDSQEDDREGHNDRWPDLIYYDPDELIAFASDRDGDWEVFSMYDDGTEQVQSTGNLDGLIDAEPSWDPLAEFMVIHSNRNGNFEIASMYYDGAEFTRLTGGHSGNDTSPDWEPVNDGALCGE